MKRIRRGVSCTIAIAISSTVLAQWREGDPPVLTPSSPPAEKQPVDEGVFTQRYKAAGSPQMVLFWNISFDDQLRTEKELSATSERRSEMRGLSSNSETITHRMRVQPVDAAKRSAALAENDYAQLQTSFTRTLRAEGVTLLDRAALMRATQVEQDKVAIGANRSEANEPDAKAVEAEAVIAKADLLIEVLLIPDAEAVLGLAFKVSVKDIKRSKEVASLYTQAIPEIAEPQGEYVATDRGFEWQQPAARKATASDVGVKLAHELMAVMGKEL